MTPASVCGSRPNYRSCSSKAIVVRLMCGLLVLFPAASVAQVAGIDIRKAFEDTAGRGPLVGRVGVFLIDRGGLRQIPIEYRFRKSERFRMLIGSNRDGHVYVLTRNAKGDYERLWPKLGSPPAVSAVQAGQEFFIPNNFVVYDDETLLIEIRSQPAGDAHDHVSGADGQEVQNEGASNSKPRISNMKYRIRGGGGDKGHTGIVYDAAGANGDFFRYFSSMTADSEIPAVTLMTLRTAK